MLKRAGLWLRSNLQRRRYEREMRAERGMFAVREPVASLEMGELPLAPILIASTGIFLVSAASAWAPARRAAAVNPATALRRG
jgi:ABC-type lipoprotein release transport system permease subunit